jgi:hypothetical protein
MNHVGLAGSQQADVVVVYVDAVSRNCFLAEYSKVVKALHDSLSVLTPALGQILRPFGGVNMESGVKFFGDLRRALEGSIAHRERGMQTEEALQHLISGLFAVPKKRPVFLNALICDLCAVAVGDLIGKAATNSGVVGCV